MQEDNPTYNDDSLVQTDEARFDTVWRFFEKWSLSAGKLFGVMIRIHILIVLGIGLWFYDVEGNRDFIVKSMQFISIIIAVLSHELTHVLVARHFDNAVKGIILMPPFGGIAFIILSSDKPLARIAISISGPLTNILMALAIWLHLRYFGPYSIYMQSFFRHLYMICLVVGIFNLIPLYPLDGGRVLKDLLLLCKANNRAASITTLLVSLSCFAGMVTLTLKMAAFGNLIILSILIAFAVYDLLFNDDNRLSAKEEKKL
ncbi:MAG: site-2 protease family protein [Nitrospirae bacterium]|nr:site-2 protease family protein [Nitrospirota bacterium]